MKGQWHQRQQVLGDAESLGCAKSHGSLLILESQMPAYPGVECNSPSGIGNDGGICEKGFDTFGAAATFVNLIEAFSRLVGGRGEPLS